MGDPIRVMLEHGKKKRVVACAFDWPGWDRSAKKSDDVLAVLEAYRPRYAEVAALAGFGAEFDAADGFAVVEQLDGIGMTDYYGLSGRPATPETGPMTAAEAERKIALLEACWRTFDETAARVSHELRTGPRGGGWEKERASSVTSTAQRSSSSHRRSASKSRWRPGTTRMRCATTERPSSRRSGNTTSVASRPGPGRCSSSFDVARGTCSTMRGSWQTAT